MSQLSPLTFTCIQLDSPPFQAEIIIYAEYEISRTPDAQQRAQTPAQSQRQIPACAAWKKISAPLLAAGKKDEAAKFLPGVHSAFDKAVKSGVLPRATVNRKKSRLAAALN